MKAQTKLVGYFEIVLVLLFLTGIVTPGLTMLFVEPSNRPGVPQRAARAPFPKVEGDWATLAAFPATFKDYMRDNFGLRQRLIYWQAAFKYHFLEVSASPSVILGTKDNWLFFADADSMVSLRNTNPYTNEELAQWKRVLDARNAVLSNKGIQYLVVIAPDKHTIYPEYLPPAYTKIHPKSRREQLVEYLKVNSNITVIDLSDTLKQAKPAGTLYLKTDTHWNVKGAFFAYEIIARQIHSWYPQFQPRPRAAFDFTEQAFSGSDLSLMLGIQDDIPDILPVLRPRTTSQVQPLNADALEYIALIRKQYQAHQIKILQCPKEELSKAVLLGDSFAGILFDYLAEHFAQTVYLYGTYHSFPTEYLLQSRPQFVMQEFIERFLAGSPPAGP